MNYKVIFSPSANQVEILKKNIKNVAYNKSNHFYYIKNVDDDKNLKNITGLCKKYHIPYKAINADYDRDTSYRKRFFSNNHGIHNKYFCAYCGKILTPEEITVDHITPVAAARKSKFAQRILKLFGITNINCNKNLAPSCRECNSKKGANIGLWPIRGYIGKHNFVWILGHTISFSVLFCVVYMFFSYGANYVNLY